LAPEKPEKHLYTPVKRIEAFDMWRRGFGKFPRKIPPENSVGQIPPRKIPSGNLPPFVGKVAHTMTRNTVTKVLNLIVQVI